MNQTSSKSFLILAFGFMIIIVAGLCFVWSVNVNENQKNIQSIFGEQKQSRLVREMRDSARQRAILLHRMAIMTDEFAIDDAYMQFKEMAGRFIGARDELLALENDAGVEREIWKRAVPKIRNGEAMQQKTLEYILEGQIYKANNLLLTEVIPIQNEVNNTLSEMLTYQSLTAEQEYNEALQRNTKIYTYVLTLGGVVVMITLITAFIVIKRTSRIEASLVEARVAAQNTTELKSQFLANMSHEIRTPLTAVLGFADNLRESGLNEADRHLSINSIIRNGHHLLQVINDILDISKIEAKQLAIEHINVSPIRLIADIDSLMGARVRDKGLKFSIDYRLPLPRTIISDPTRLKQILLNLCSNAAKFTEAGGVEIQVSYQLMEDKMQFVVKDSGIGMSREEIDKLFKPFSQADESTTRKYGGTGLGLYISKQLAQMLGGDLSCVSEAGKGSVFTLKVKARVKADAEFIYDLRSVSSQEMENKTVEIPRLEGEILLVEDSTDNQALISMYIRKTGARVTMADNGQRAIELALEKNYDLILMDMQMPIMGGVDAVKWLRQTGNQTPIVMLTANAMKAERDKCINLGANDFLTKPIESAQFYQALARYLSPVTAGSELLAGKNTFVHEFEDLRVRFVAGLPGTLKHLQSLLKQEDWSSLKLELHRLKGVGGGLGFTEVTRLCREVEHALAEDDWNAATRTLLELFQCCADIIEDNTPKTSMAG